ncbi:Dabb family protein [Pleomorphomonas koreensis]|uniref:Dabb family protein n=1 Tax=Pleomorphomonas koreensis TaxID=257440 RepID=UPI000421661E|nr:Dabb family protein [Pleomorphomonas koreensis]
MILHCVFLKMPAAATTADVLKLYGAVAALKPIIPGMLDFKAGPNVSPEGLDRGFHHGFVVTFDDEAARDAYLIHPEHVKVGNRIVAATDGGLEGILVYDLSV